MTPVRIIGIGSPFGADRAGWLAVARLAARNDWPRPVEWRTLDRPGTALLDHLSGADHVILIDALLDGGAGTVRRLQPSELKRTAPLSSHGAGVAETLDLGRTLGLLPPRLDILGIPVAGIEDPALPDESALAECLRQLLAAD